jgi:hypothetical protein
MAIGQATKRGVVQSRPKRQVTADEKAAEGLEESALALELVCEEARAAGVALENAKAEYNNYLWQAQYRGCYWLSTATS